MYAVQRCVQTERSTQRTQEFAAEYNRVSIRLHTHISVLETHKGLKGTVVNQAFPSLHGGSLKSYAYSPFKL